ncbi:MAG: WhiB family transcriptional regulator [Acidimicrobiales bacterium]|jgi:WhiB family redox-sensing transcriptional regulator
MPAPVSGGRAHFPGGVQTAASLGPQRNNVAPLPQRNLKTATRDPIRPGGLANAACRGMDLDFFFPTSGPSLDRARRVCSRCPIEDKCLATALEDVSLHGIWGGTSARERQYLRSEEGLGWG